MSLKMTRIKEILKVTRMKKLAYNVSGVAIKQMLACNIYFHREVDNEGWGVITLLETCFIQMLCSEQNLFTTIQVLLRRSHANNLKKTVKPESIEWALLNYCL